MQCHCGSTAQYVLGRDGKPNFSCAQGRCKFWSVGPSSCEGYPRVVLNQPHPPAGTVIIRFEATLHPGELGLPGVMAMCEGEIPEGHAVRQLLQSDEFQGTWYPSRRAFLYILPRYAALLTQLQELSRNSHNVNNPCSFPLHIEPIPKFFFKCLNNANLLVKSHVSDLPDNEDFVYQKLHNFQKEGVHFLLQHGGRGMIADEMGLGKTVQAIAAAHYYREEWPLLIVCPMSLMENWAKEVNRFCSIPFSRIMLIQGKKTSKRSGSEEAGECVKDVVIASYHSLQEVPQDLASGFRVLIFDESHYIKTPNSKRTKYALELCSKANRVILLSGTPALSRPMELYTQLRAIAPPSATPILPSTSQFAARYCNAHICSRGTIFTVNTDGHSHTDELHLLLQHFMIRRRKSELGEGALPSKSRRLVYITVEEKGKARLEKQVSALRKSIESQPSSIGEQGWAPKTQNVFELKMATAQAKIPGIINYVATTVEKHRLSKEKLILFGHHQCMMDALKEAVEKAGKNHPVDFILISGDTPSNQREVLAEHFRSDPNCLVAILSMQSSGVGHNFTCASTVIFSELDWNPSMHLQCEDRVHRIGQSRSCVIQYLLAEGTADAVLWPLLNSKLSVTTAVLCGTSDNGNDCTSATGKLDVDAAERVVISSQRTIDEFLPRRSTDSSGDRPRAAKESPRRVSSLDGNAAQSLEIEKSDVHSAGVVSFASMANDKTWRETAFSPPIPGVPRSQKTTRGALPNEVAAPRSAHASPRNAPNATFIPTLVGAPCVPSHGSSPLMGRRTTFVLKSHGANASPANASGSSDALLHGEESQIHPVSEIKVSSHLAADSCSDNDPEAGQKRKRDHHEASSGLRSHGIDSRSPLRVHNDVPLGSASRDLAGETTLSERKTAPAILRPSNGSSVIPSERAPIVSGVAFPHSGSGEFLESQIQEAQSLLFSQRDDSQKGRTSQVSVNICQPSFKENVNRRSLTPEFTQPRKRTLVRAYTSPQPLPSTAPGKTVSDITPSSPTAPQLRCSHNSIDLSNDSGVNLPLTGDQKTSTCAITAPFTDLPKDSEALKGEGEGLSAALPSSCVEIPLQLLLKPVCHSSSDMTANYGLPARKTFILRHNTKQS